MLQEFLMFQKKISCMNSSHIKDEKQTKLGVNQSEISSEGWKPGSKCWHVSFLLNYAIFLNCKVCGILFIGLFEIGSHCIAKPKLGLSRTFYVPRMTNMCDPHVLMSSVLRLQAWASTSAPSRPPSCVFTCFFLVFSLFVVSFALLPLG